MNAAIVILAEASLALARRIKSALPGSRIHGLTNRTDAGDVPFTETGVHLRSLFEQGTPIIGICASGILIRTLGHLAADKTSEPPVIAVSQDGKSVVPLLGGHHGANALARTIADALDGHAAVTTAGDTVFGIALDEPPAGVTLANPEDAKAFAASLLAGKPVSVEGQAPWLEKASLPIEADAPLTIAVTECERTGDAGTLVYHPRTLALGVGCERGCAPQELETLVRTALADTGLSAFSVGAIVSVDLKCDEPAVTALATALGVPARFYNAATLEAETPRLANPSEYVFRTVGCHGVAEGAALAATGPGGVLIVEKRKSARATCAIAQSPSLLEPSTIGRGRGILSIVGLGPGTQAWRTEEAGRLIEAATDIVGYSGYIDLLGTATKGKALHPYKLGEETDRVDAALDLAAEGKNVALVCSGDPGIYAMAALAFERLDTAHRPNWRFVDITVAPGISALQAAAARIGAPLGHDFCAISLSDLLTPWEAIAKRLNAAAEGDFVTALYNPASQRRRTQLVEALAVFAKHRAPDTPIVAARQLGRPEENIRIHRLADFDPETVDMLTVLLIGSTETRVIEDAAGPRYVYTPRGYAGKSPAKQKAAS